MLGKGKAIEHGKVLEYMEVVKFGIEMMLGLGMFSEA